MTETRQLGRSGLTVPVLSFGTMTFGGKGDFAAIGKVSGAEAERQVGLCLDAGVTLFDTADMYSVGASEEVLGAALGRHRNAALIATKAFNPMGPGPHDRGNSRQHLIDACEASLRRLKTDRIDLYQLHGFDAMTPLEETLRVLDDLVRAGKVRYVGCSNFSGWHLMKALAISEREGLERFASQQINYSLASRDAEYELLPLTLDQNVGVLVWSPLASGFLTGKFRRGQTRAEGTRLADRDEPSLYDSERGYDIVEALDAIAQQRGVSVSQVAINWLLRRPGVSSVIIGARTEAQLKDNLAAATWTLTAEEVARLDAASAPAVVPYPYWHQRKYAVARNPLPPTYRV